MFIVNAFNEGGPAMFLILAFGIFSIFFILERFVALYSKYKTTPTTFRSQLMTMIMRGDFAAAEKFATDSQTPVGNIIAVGCKVRAAGGADEEVQARMDERLSAEINKVDRRTGFLAMFGNVATLVGLLGTIAGMIHSFAAVATATPMERATLLSKGISEAMNCTAFGLLVAIPALVTFALFQNKTDQIVHNLTQSTSEMYHDIIFYFQGNAKGTAVRTQNFTEINH